MAATTITRATLTDGVTVWNAAVVGTAIYDKIDALIAGTINFGGLVGTEGFGTHSFTAGGTGGNILKVANTTAGTGNFAQVVLYNDADVTLSINALSTTFTTSGLNTQDGVNISTPRAGGMSLGATHGSGELRLFSGGSTLSAKFGAADRCLQLEFGLWLTGSYDQTIDGTTALTSTGQYKAHIRLTSCINTPKISSCTAGNDGDIKIITNVSGSACTVQHNGGAPGTRIYCANATDGTIGDDEAMMLIYDAGSSSWIEVGPR